MSSKSKHPARTSVTPAPATPHVSGDGHEHEDDLIVAPKGSNRLRFFLTLALVLFVLVMFVVADLFTMVIGGGARSRENPIYLTWRDPVAGEDESIDGREFELTRRMLSQLGSMGLYTPDSSLSSRDFRSRPEVTEADVASFLVYEDLAEDAGVALSEREFKGLLKMWFETSENIRQRARDYQMQPRELEERIRRVRRVEKLKDLLRSGTRLPDPDQMIASWQESHQQHQFQYAVLATADATAEAAAAPPDDEALLAWWRTQPQWQQQQLYTEEKTVPQVAWLDLAGSFDETALVTAFPRPDGIDEEQLARTYYDRYRAVRFLDPDPEPTPTETPETDPDAAQPVAYLEFEEVRDAALREAKIEAALTDLIKDLDQRMAGGESVDLGVEAARYGLETYTAPEAMTRAELAQAEGWGNQDLGQRLGFGPVGKLLGNVVVNGTRMYLGRVVERSAREEQPIEAIRDAVLKKWTTFRAGELTVERAEALVAAMAERPAEHPEEEPWQPVVDGETFERVLTEAGLEVMLRPWLEQRELPSDAGPVPSEVDRFFQNDVTELYELPEGAVGQPKPDQAGQKVYIVRHAGKRPKPFEELAPKDLANLPMTVRFESLTDLSEKIFVGDSEWFESRFQVRFPEREKREAEAAAGESPKPAGA